MNQKRTLSSLEDSDLPPHHKHLMKNIIQNVLITGDTPQFQCPGCGHKQDECLAVGCIEKPWRNRVRCERCKADYIHDAAHAYIPVDTEEV